MLLTQQKKENSETREKMVQVPETIQMQYTNNPIKKWFCSRCNRHDLLTQALTAQMSTVNFLKFFPGWCQLSF